MRELKDKNTGLVWLIPENESPLRADQIYIPEDGKAVEEFTRELNQYSSDAITRFVTGDCAQLGDFIQWVLMDKRKSCYCFEDGKLVGASVLTPNTNVDRLFEIQAYVDYCEANPTMFNDGIIGYISYKKAKQILESTTKSNNTYIDYLVVVPTAQHKGVGTRAIHSIKHNPEFFAPEQQTKTMSVQIHDENTASQAVFRRNNFGKYSFSTDKYNSYTPLNDYITTL